MVARCISYWNSPFSGAMLVSGRLHHFEILFFSTLLSHNPPMPEKNSKARNSRDFFGRVQSPEPKMRNPWIKSHHMMSMNMNPEIITVLPGNMRDLYCFQWITIQTKLFKSIFFEKKKVLSFHLAMSILHIIQSSLPLPRYVFLLPQRSYQTSETRKLLTFCDLLDLDSKSQPKNLQQHLPCNENSGKV